MACSFCELCNAYSIWIGNADEIRSTLYIAKPVAINIQQFITYTIFNNRQFRIINAIRCVYFIYCFALLFDR